VITDLDAIYCINLERRPDRWESFKQVWSPYDLKISKFSAVDAQDLMYEKGEYANHSHFHNLGSLGCTLSHIQVLERALYSKQKEILILEDDAVPCEDFVGRFNTAYSELPDDYQFCYVGGSNITPPEKLTGHVGIAKNTKSTAGYLIKTALAPTIIQFVKAQMFNAAIDEVYAAAQQQLPIHIFTPRLIHQEEGYSDIINQNVNYSWMRDL
tara:strand:- start:4743 stop:5378 length:636 start_codon:yes stop_codon:yes gene_type:complete